ncbi:MAG: BlaI/MecI/CopY family transcriptional regulator [Planctomycetota bacterium]
MSPAKRKPISADNKKLPSLTDAQIEVMQVVWDRKRVSVSDVWETLRNDREIARNTVLTVMDRLAKKGWLVKTVIGKMNFYEAAVGQQETLGRMISRLVDGAFSGSVDRLMLALLDTRGISTDEADRIEKMIHQSRKESVAKRKRNTKRPS